MAENGCNLSSIWQKRPKQASDPTMEHSFKGLNCLEKGATEDWSSKKACKSNPAQTLMILWVLADRKSLMKEQH